MAEPRMHACSDVAGAARAASTTEPPARSRSRRRSRTPSERHGHLVRSACMAILALVLIGVASTVLAAPPSAVAEAPRTAHAADAERALEARLHAITVELRCLVCQNQTLADSDAALAVDLRAQMRTLLRAGVDDAAVRAHLTERYGDFVLYRPPLRATTLVLWLGPAALLATGLASLLLVVRQRRRLADDRFEAGFEDEGLEAGGCDACSDFNADTERLATPALP